MNEKYDPITGELLNQGQEPEPPAESHALMETDPYTGQIGDGNREPILNYPPAGGALEDNHKKSRLPLVIGIAAVVVAAFAGIAFAVANSGIFVNDTAKVLLAITNTLRIESQFAEDLEALNEIAGYDDFTVGMEVDMEGIDIDVDYAVTDAQQQAAGSVSYGGIVNINFAAALTSDQLQLQVGMMEDYVFTYDYKKENSGYILESFSREDIEGFNEMLDMLYSQTGKVEPEGRLEYIEDMARIFSDLYHSFEFEKADSKGFQVDGKERSCTGYRTLVTADMLDGLLDELEPIFERHYASQMNYAFGISEAGGYGQGMFDNIRSGLEGMPDLETTFYIYKDRLACLSLENEHEEVQFLFDSNKDGLQAMEVLGGSEKVLEFEKSVTDSEESYDLRFGNGESHSLKYNHATGDFEGEVKEDWSSGSAKGNYQADSQGIRITVDDVENNGQSMDMSFQIEIKEGATLQKIEGTEYDLGNATEEELVELLSGFSSLFGF